MVLSHEVVIEAGLEGTMTHTIPSSLSVCCLWLNLWLLSSSCLCACLMTCVHSVMMIDCYLSGTVSPEWTLFFFFLNVALVMVFYYNKRNVTSTGTNRKWNRLPESVRPALLFLNNETATFQFWTISKLYPKNPKLFVSIKYCKKCHPSLYIYEKHISITH